MTKPEDKIHPPLDIDELLIRRPRNKISNIGIELEGGWETIPKGSRPVPDASVFKDPVTNTQKAPVGCGFVGEIPSHPLIPIEAPTWLRKYYPKVIDKTCGLHVHMSFPTFWHYDQLMVPQYPPTVREYIRRWAKEEDLVEEHPLWERLSGKSEYCQFKFWPDEQFNAKRKDYDHFRKGCRYTDINYSGAHKTIECRLLPMMANPEQAVRVVRRLIDITNCVLFSVAKRDGAIEEIVSIDHSDLYSGASVEFV